MFFDFTVYPTVQTGTNITLTEKSFKSHSFLKARKDALAFISAIEKEYRYKGLKFKKRSSDKLEPSFFIILHLNVFKSKDSDQKILDAHVDFFNGKYPPENIAVVRNKETVFEVSIGGFTPKTRALRELENEIVAYKKYKIDVSKIGTRKVKDFKGHEYTILADSWLWWERKK